MIKWGYTDQDFFSLFRNDCLFSAQNSNSTLVEAVGILLSGDVKINREDQIGSGEVQVHG